MVTCMDFFCLVGLLKVQTRRFWRESKSREWIWIPFWHFQFLSLVESNMDSCAAGKDAASPFILIWVLAVEPLFNSICLLTAPLRGALRGYKAGSWWVLNRLPYEVCTSRNICSSWQWMNCYFYPDRLCNESWSISRRSLVGGVWVGKKNKQRYCSPQSSHLRLWHRAPMSNRVIRVMGKQVARRLEALPADFIILQPTGKRYIIPDMVHIVILEDLDIPMALISKWKLYSNPAMVTSVQYQPHHRHDNNGRQHRWPGPTWPRGRPFEALQALRMLWSEARILLNL